MILRPVECGGKPAVLATLNQLRQGLFCSAFSVWWMRPDRVLNRAKPPRVYTDEADLETSLLLLPVLAARTNEQLERLFAANGGC